MIIYISVAYLQIPTCFITQHSARPRFLFLQYLRQFSWNKEEIRFRPLSSSTLVDFVLLETTYRYLLDFKPYYNKLFDGVLLDLPQVDLYITQRIKTKKSPAPTGPHRGKKLCEGLCESLGFCLCSFVWQIIQKIHLFRVSVTETRAWFPYSLL